MPIVNQKAGFWSRLIYFLIDFIFFSSIAISTSLICIKKEFISDINNEIYLVANDYWYFLWLLFLIINLSFFFIIIPLIFNGKTLGMMIIRLKVNFNSSKKYQSILKRMELGVFLWIFIVLIFMCFVWPNTINKMIIRNYIEKHSNEFGESLNDLMNLYQWNILETSFYSIPSVISPIVVIIQLFSFMSVLYKGNKTTFVDKISDSQIVHSKKFVEIVDYKNIELEPEKNIVFPIIWKD